MKDAQREQKKSRNTSYADITDLWYFKEVAFLAKPWRGAQSTQLRKLSLASQGHMPGSQGEFIWKSYMQGACKLAWVICIYEWAEV